MDRLRIVPTGTIVSDQTYQFDYTYNAVLGQLETVTYPTSTAGVRFKAKLGYLAGYLASVQDYTGNVNGSVLWNLNLLDARMNATSETYGNGLWLQNGYDALTGVPTTRKSGTGGQQSNVQNLAYGWDLAGNLTSRQDLLQSISETFTYDALDRLTLASGPASQSTAIGYDAIGNLTSKTGVGSYTYHATKKHAVVNAGGTGYGYDGNGNLISRGGATVGWSSYNYPTNIGDPNGYSAQFWYAPDRSRWKQVSTYSGATETTIYVGGLLEKFTNAVTTHWKHIVPTPSGEVQVIRRANGTSETLYVTTDPLGSTDAVLNAAGTVVMRASFAAYGERRASHWQGAPSGTEWQAIADTTRRGYTGHEAIDNVMLVHMNGRVFDPRLGRFLSADPFVSCAGSTQAWNRFSYVDNRSLSRVDPSGFFLEVIVTASRIYNSFTNLGTPAAGSFGGGYEPREGPPARDRNRGDQDPDKRPDPNDKKECVVNCEKALKPAVQAVAGALAGGLTATILAPSLHSAASGAVAGAALGAITGFLPDDGATPVVAGTVLAGAAAMLEGRLSRSGTTPAGLIGTVVGEAIGGGLEINDSAAVGGFAGGVASGLLSRGSFTVRTFVGFRGSFAGLVGGYIYDRAKQGLDYKVTDYCANACGQ